jgi:hypothetical protein
MTESEVTALSAQNENEDFTVPLFSLAKIWVHCFPPLAKVFATCARMNVGTVPMGEMAETLSLRTALVVSMTDIVLSM